MSSETVEDDDNMILLVVEDKKHSNDRKRGIPKQLQTTVNVDSLDESGDWEKSGTEIFKSPSQTEDEEEFQIEYLDEYNIKEEVENKYDIEYLEDDEEVSSQRSDDGDIKPEFIKLRNGHKVKIVSIIKKLRRDRPEFAQNREKLVEYLANIMRNTRPPKPPENYYKLIMESADKELYECSYCERQTETLPEASRHYQFYHGENYLTCFACGNQYRNTIGLYKHEKRCPAPDAKLVLQARGRHLGRKGRGRPYITNNKFVRPTPTKDKERLLCSMCPSSFSHSQNLKAHINTHLGLRPFACRLCPNRYTILRGLKRHIQARHSDDKFICDHCSAEFTLKESLISHLNSHRQLRKYPCQYCERRFAHKSSLLHHTNRVHLNLPSAHQCPACPNSFARMTHVRDHMQKAHGLTMISRAMLTRLLPKMAQLPETVNATVIYNDKNKIMTPTPEFVENDVTEIIPDFPHSENMDKNEDFRCKEETYSDRESEGPLISFYVFKDGVPVEIDIKKNQTDTKSEKKQKLPLKATQKKKLTTNKVKTKIKTKPAKIVDGTDNDDSDKMTNAKTRMQKQYKVGSDTKKTLRKRKSVSKSPAYEHSAPENSDNEMELLVERRSKRRKKSVYILSDKAPKKKKNIRKCIKTVKSKSGTEPAAVDEIVDDDFDKMIDLKSKREKNRISDKPIDDIVNKVGCNTRGKLTEQKSVLKNPVSIKLEDDFDKKVDIERKREKKSNIETEINPIDESEYKVVYDIKSTLKKPKSTVENYVIVRKGNINKPDDDNKLTQNSVSTSKVTVLGTKIPNVKKLDKQNKTEDVKDWEVFKKQSEKNKLVTEFMEYMASKKVPKPQTVPILRKKLKNPEPNESAWLKKSRDEFQSVDEDEANAVNITEVLK